MIERVTVLLLCGVGLYASAFMTRKAIRARRGELHERSVVESSRASVGRVPNGAIGIVYYLALAAAVFVPAVPWWALVAAATAAAAFSLYLAYSLLFVTRAACVYCWTSHAVNWTLLVLVALLRP